MSHESLKIEKLSWMEFKTAVSHVFDGCRMVKFDWEIKISFI